jgi:hypothetical protein
MTDDTAKETKLKLAIAFTLATVSCGNAERGSPVASPVAVSSAPTAASASSHAPPELEPGLFALAILRDVTLQGQAATKGG